MNSLFFRSFFSATLLISIVYANAQCPTNETDFTNGGTFSGPCTEDYGGTITITGDVIWSSGTFDLRDGDNNGLIIASGGSLTINGGTITMNDADGGNDGFVTVQAGGTLTVAGGTLNIEEDLNITGGTVDIQSGGTINTTQAGDIDLTSGTLTVSGTLNSNDDMTVSAGANLVINNTGTVQIDGQSGLSGNVDIYGDLISDQGIRIPGGDVTVYDGGSIDSGDELFVGGASGTLDIQEGATVDVTEELSVGRGLNTGTVTLNGEVTAGSVDIVNASSTLTGTTGVLTTSDFENTGGGTNDFDSCLGAPSSCSLTASVEILNAPTAVNSVSGFSVTFEFSTDVTGFAIGDITLGNATASAFNATDGNTYTATITPDSPAGVTIDVASDVVNEDNSAAIQVSVNYDVASPTVAISNEPSSASTSFNITITFNENIDNSTFAIGDITVTNGLASNLVETVATTTYTVDITPDDGGDISVFVSAGVADDLAGNSNTVSNTINVTYVEALDAGDVMFVTLSSESESGTTGDGFGFVTLVDIPANQVLYITDHEWNTGSPGTWTTGNFDGFYSWTNANAVLPAGSIIVVTDVPSTPVTDNVGTTINLDGTINRNMRDQNEEVYIYTADAFNDPSSTVFLTAIATDGFGGALGELPSTLTVGTNAIEFTNDSDFFAYTGSTTCDGTLLECQQMLANTANWQEDTFYGDSSGEFPPAVDSPLDPGGSSGGFGGKALPVKLISFNGELYEGQQIAQLSWVTGTEIDNEGFYIERSLDGVEFDEIGFVEGNGSTYDLQEYTFLDYNINISSYYRLRQVDYDGQFEFSPLVFVSMVNSNSDDPIKLYPNPAIREIKLSGLVNERYDIQVVDMTGKVILNMTGSDLNDAELAINQALLRVRSGLFLIKFVNPGYAETIRLIKN